MYNYLMDRLRDNLHVCLCFSPVNAKFPIRAQKFPAVFTVNINWKLGHSVWYGEDLAHFCGYG